MVGEESHPCGMWNSKVGGLGAFPQGAAFHQSPFQNLNSKKRSSRVPDGGYKVRNVQAGGHRDLHFC